MRKASRTVKESRLSTSSEDKKEMMLLRTLAITFVVFFLCWSGYAVVIIIDPIGIGHHAKKVSIVLH